MMTPPPGHCILGLASRGTGSNSGSRPALVRLAVVLLAAMGSMGCSQHRIATGPPLQLHRQFGGYKFTYNSPAEQSVWDWFALDPAFTSVLERHPAALETARKAGPAHATSWGLALAFTAYSIKTTFSSETDNLGLVTYPHFERDIAILAVLGVGASVFERVARGQLNRAVSQFNGEEGGSLEEGTAQGGLFEHVRLSPTYEPGNRLGLVGTFSFR